MSEPVNQVTGLVRRYGEIEAVRGIDAGKSTTIKILCTLANPTSEFARVAGFDVIKERDDARRNTTRG